MNSSFSIDWTDRDKVTNVTKGAGGRHTTPEVGSKSLPIVRIWPGVRSGTFGRIRRGAQVIFPAAVVREAGTHYFEFSSLTQPNLEFAERHTPCLPHEHGYSR